MKKVRYGRVKGGNEEGNEIYEGNEGKKKKVTKKGSKEK